MNKTRKSSLMVRLVALLAVAMMFTMCFVGGTFAKYTSSATGSDSARVAKWAFKVSNANIVTENNFTFDLFNNTVKDSGGTSNETDMSPTDGTIIAPGTSGSFDIVLKNESEVNATYAIDYTVTNTSNIPVKFSIDGTDWKDDIHQLNVSDISIAMGGSATVTVHWKWEFYVDSDKDTADTTLGKNAAAATLPENAPTITVSAKVTATQVD